MSQLPSKKAPSSLKSKLLIYAIPTSVSLILLLRINSPASYSPSLKRSWSNILNVTCLGTEGEDGGGGDTASRLRDSVTFLPLTDHRFAGKPLEGNTWFMSSLNGTRDEEGGVLYLKIPGASSKGRVLCLKGRNSEDATWNSYALAWRDHLPRNSVWMKGLTFVSYEHFRYDNIWHAASSMLPFAAWYNNECRSPERWILYSEGKLKAYKVPWVTTLMGSIFGHFKIESFESIYGGNDSAVSGYSDDDASACFEEALVMRHNEAGMSIENRRKSYDTIRCKSRIYCNATSREKPKSDIGMTILMRKTTRSFKNSSAVIDIFQRACDEVEGCHLRAAYADELSPCDQVELMSSTDVLISPHGAQLTNMFLMDRNSSVMELFPDGFIEYGRNGNHFFHWLAGASGMIHRGNWYDDVGEPCLKPEGPEGCLSVVKGRRIGHNETYFMEWAGKVLQEAKLQNVDSIASGVSKGCTCGSKSYMDAP